MKVCLVGNSANLLGRGLGKRIDEFLYVGRFNDFQIKGYETDVGTKTTFWFCNPSVVEGFLSNGRPPRFPDCIVLQTLEFTQERSMLPYLFFPSIPLSIINDIRTVVGLNEFNLSTGIQAIAFMASLYGKVHVVGFDFWQSTCSLYFQQRDGLFHPHHSSLELRYYNLLKDRGAIIEL